MTSEYLNNGEPLPHGHRKHGQVGLVIDFEDGSDPQYVYAANQAEMTTKLATMYGNTRKERNAPKPATPAPAAPAPAPTPAPAMTIDERVQAVADLGDPARVGEAMKKILKADGFDVDEQNRQKAAEAETARLTRETNQFVTEHPDWPGGKVNADLLRDKTIARVGRKFTAADLHQSYIELQEMGVLQSVSVNEPPTAANTEEPSAPPPTTPRVSTGIRPSSLGARPGTLPTGQPAISRQWVLENAGSDEYARRMVEEPGFIEKVNAALN